MLQYRQLPKGTVPKRPDHVIFTVIEALQIHKALHSQLAAITMRGSVCPIKVTDNGTRWVLVHQIECTQQDQTDSSQWAEYARKGHKITWIKSPDHWGRIVNGKIGNKGTAITGYAEDYHMGGEILQPKKKQKISASNNEDISTTNVNETTQEKNSESLYNSIIVPPPSGRQFLILAQYKETKKKLSFTASSISDIQHQLLTAFDIPPHSTFKMEYEDEDFKTFITPTYFEEIPNKTRIRLVDS